MKTNGKKEKPVVLQIFFFQVHFRSKKNPDKIKNWIFKVYATKQNRAKLRVENYCERESVRPITVAGIEPREARDRTWIELGLPKDKKIKIGRIELKRLVKLRHKTFGFVWIADPLLPVTKKIVGDHVAFFVPAGKDHVMVKTLLFDPKFFDLKLEVVEKLIDGAHQHRKAKIKTIRCHLDALEEFCDRAHDLDLDSINDSVIKQIDVAAKQSKVISMAIAKRIVERFHAIRKSKIDSFGSKYPMERALRKAFRMDLDNRIQDLELACKILRGQGFKIFDPHLIF